MKHKYTLITGASGEIGGAIAEQLAKEGHHLYLHYHQNQYALEQLIRRLAVYPVEIIKIQADLTRPDGFQKISTVIEQIDHIVLTAGTSEYGVMTETAVDTVNRMIQLHLTSIYQLIQALLPKLILQKSGVIVFLTSIWGEIGASCEVLYSTLKGGQNTFVKALAKEVAPSHIRVNAVSPGAVATKMMADFEQEGIQRIEGEIPLGRLAVPMEVADAVTFLISEKSSYITGQIISVNGGWNV